MVATRKRSAIALTLFGAAVLSVLGLLALSRGGGVSQANVTRTLTFLLEYFGPAMGLIVGFFFPGKKAKLEIAGESGGDARFVLALGLALAWGLAPATVFFFRETIEDSLEVLKILATWGNPFFLAMLGYYYSHTWTGAK